MMSIDSCACVRYFFFFAVSVAMGKLFLTTSASASIHTYRFILSNELYRFEWIDLICCFNAAVVHLFNINTWNQSHSTFCHPAHTHTHKIVHYSWSIATSIFFSSSFKSFSHCCNSNSTIVSFRPTSYFRYRSVSFHFQRYIIPSDISVLLASVCMMFALLLVKRLLC